MNNSYPKLLFTPLKGALNLKYGAKLLKKPESAKLSAMFFSNQKKCVLLFCFLRGLQYLCKQKAISRDERH